MAEGLRTVHRLANIFMVRIKQQTMVMKGITASRGNVFVKVWCGLKGGYKQTPLHGGAVQVESS